MILIDLTDRQIRLLLGARRLRLTGDFMIGGSFVIERSNI